jgi:hypothetical protein
MSATWPALVKSDPPPPYAQITATASDATSALARALRDAFQDAMGMRGRLPEAAYRVHGFSGKKFRLFMNNLMHDVPDPRYLEIGLFHGASFCSAVAKNRLTALGIDNWTEFGGKRAFFDANLDAFRSEGANIQVLEQDFRKVPYGSVGKFNILFYDGSHTEKDQYDGVMFPQPAMDDTYIMIIDDWNWERVRNGTFKALGDAKLTVDYSVEVRTTFNNDHLPLVHGPGSEWHNGMIAAVLTRR